MPAFLIAVIVAFVAFAYYEPAHVRDFRKLVSDPEVCELAKQAQMWSTVLMALPQTKESRNWYFVADATSEACALSKVPNNHAAVRETAERLKRTADALQHAS